MFENRSFENLLKEILESAPEDIDVRQGSIFYDAVAGVTMSIAKLYTDLELVFGLSRVDTASGEYLDTRASEYGVHRHKALPAKYTAVFTGAIPEDGERFFCGETYFILRRPKEGACYGARVLRVLAGRELFLFGRAQIPSRLSLSTPRAILSAVKRLKRFRIM